MIAKPPRRIAILGALSGVAEATARRLAAEGAALALAARRADDIASLSDDLKVRGASLVSVHGVDLAEESDKAGRLAEMAAALGGLDAILLFYGVLGDQQKAESDPVEVRKIIAVNFTSAAEWLTVGAALLDASPALHPVLLAVSSVAGDRGRRSNYAYGAAKGGLSVFVQGLAHRLAAKGRTRAVAVKLGFVRTSMTAHMNTKGPLWASADAAAEAIIRSMTRGGPIVYAPWFWRWIMLAVRVTPAAIFNKVNL